MTFPTAAISTANLDTSSGDPSLARADLLQAVESLNTIIDEADGASGVAVLDGTARIKSSQMPASIAPSTDLTLAPTTKRVKIQTLLNLDPVTTDELTGLYVGVEGDVAYVTDGDAGDPCLAVYTGSQWSVISLGGAIAKDVQAAVTATATLECAPDA